MKFPQVLRSLTLSTLLLASDRVPAQVVISEFQADNKKTLADADGQYADWIELFNTNSTSVNLGGWSLTDDPTHLVRWAFPSTNLSAKAMLVVFASGKNHAVAGAPLHTDFNLRASGDYLALLRPDGSVATEFAPAYPEQYTDFSYGLAQNVTTNVLIASGATGRVLVPTDGSLGTNWTQSVFSDAAWTSGKMGIGYETAVPGFAVYNYVANVGVCSLDTAYEVISNPAQQIAVFAENAATIDYFNTGGQGHYSGDNSFPGLSVGQDQDNFAVHALATITIPAAGEWTFGVNSDDGFDLNVGGFNSSFPSPRGPDDTLATFSFPAAGDYPLELVFYECGGGSGVELFAAQGAFDSWNPTDFHLVGDTANGGLQVTAPVVANGGAGTGYRSSIGTDLETSMKGVNATAYIRVPFTVANPTALQSLTLRAKYDDGFVAYLNGVEVARRNAPTSPQWNSAATASHPNHLAGQFEEINLSDYLGALRTGSNVLAIQALNETSNDLDFLFAPELVEYKSNALGYQYFATPTPGGLNGAGFTAIVADTKFSVDRGFFDTPFTVAITSATANASIRFTTNGSTPSVSNGYPYTGPIPISGTTVLRAIAYRQGFQPSGVDTQTYLFLSDVIRQSPTGQAPAGWPSSWGGNTVDYGMDPNVVNDAAYSGEIVNDLKQLPSFSIVTDLPNLFDPSRGIYANPGGDGMDWERPASIELLYPDGSRGFQVNAGIRIRGGYSRSGSNPKHAFRFFFRQQYGASKLDFPMFASQGGASTFDSFDLRTFQNYSWSFEGDYRFIGLRDQWSRDTQVAMGQPAERGDFYHLYINGQYWGLYNTDERAEASYAETYFGGNKEDYDVIKVDTGVGYAVYATDGNMDAWVRLWRAATNGFANDADYFRVQGLKVDGTPNPGYENLLDVDNLIDYMLVIFFSGNLDAPISEFLGNDSPNNMYAVRNRTGQYGGFRFFAHDSEHTLNHESGFGSNEINRDRTGPFAAGDPTRQGTATALSKSNPQYIFTRLSANAEFRMRLADRIQKYFFNSGVLTTETCRARFLTRSNEIYAAVVGESARWGDSKREPPRTRNQDWVTEMNRVYGDYFGRRPGIVLGQLKSKGWFPAVSAPTFSQMGGNIPEGFQLTLSGTGGTIYYTRDGSDPRLRGGAVSANAVAYSSPVTLNNSALIRARVLSGGTWSALSEGTFYVNRDFTELLLTEIMYHPPGTTNLNSDAFEFLELKNVGSSELELSGVAFTNGIRFTFAIGTFLAPGQFKVLVADPAAFTNRYPGVRVDGVYSGHLANNGERIALVHANGRSICSVTYGNTAPWPPSADGAGFSIVPLNPNFNPNPADALNWRASSVIGGSPGADDPPSSIARIIVNELLTHTDPPALDSVELFNPYATNVDIGNWYLTDDRTQPAKFRIPPNTVIPANGFKVFTEADWNASPSSPSSFRLDSHGEQIYLYSADANGTLTGYSDGFAFGAAQNGVTFGRHINSVGEIQYPAQFASTLGASNAGPRIGPVVINEIMYHPPLAGDEFIELKSVTNATVNLFDPLALTNTWRLSGAGFSFPTNVHLPANGLLLVVGTEPAAFRAKYNVPAAVQIFGPFAGVLQGGGETLALQYPDHPDLDTNTGTYYTPYIDMDVVRYDDNLPWPVGTDGLGSSIEKVNASLYGNDPAAWRASPGPPSPGLENTGNRPPVVSAGNDVSTILSSLPFPLPLQGIVTDDGEPKPSKLTFAWSQISGPGTVWFDNIQAANATAHLPGIGTYVLRLTASDGELSGFSDLTVQLDRTTTPLTLVPRGSIWKYLDDGSNQGTAWTGRTFNDRSWAAGPAPLGYGDADGIWPATTNSYGPNSSSKYVTTYYRHSFVVANATSLMNVRLGVQRDDGVVVYLNGTRIFSNNMPDAFDYQTAATGTVGNADETQFLVATIPASTLVSGTNVLAAEVHQVNRTSTDIIFDLELAADGFPASAAPTVNAGADQSVTLPAAVMLDGSVSDDGLPIPPGLLSLAWSKVSGPGTVTFAEPVVPNTTATFSTAGAYVLQLTANDGGTTVSDLVTINVVGNVTNPATIESAVVSSGANPTFQMSFTTQAGASYTVQYRDSAGSTWLKLVDVPSASGGSVQVTDPDISSSSARFYRVVSPQQP